MTLHTPSFGLPYPDILDEPCDFAQDWCAFTDAVNAVATRYEATINRTVPTIPMARMTLTSSVTIFNTGLVPFDSVSVNTAGWIDFDASNTDIVPDRAGFFVLNSNLLLATTGVLGAVATMQFGDLISQDNQIDRASSGIGLTLARVHQVTTPLPLNVRVQITGAGATSVTIGSGSFSVWWHADTATP